MAREFGPKGINVNCICPGQVATSRMDDILPEDAVTAQAGASPVSRWGTDEEVGELAAFLCTAKASWIHGQSINQCGGRVMEH